MLEGIFFSFPLFSLHTTEFMLRWTEKEKKFFAPQKIPIFLFLFREKGKKEQQVMY